MTFRAYESEHASRRRPGRDRNGEDAASMQSRAELEQPWSERESVRKRNAHFRETSQFSAPDPIAEGGRWESYGKLWESVCVITYVHACWPFLEIMHAVLCRAKSDLYFNWRRNLPFRAFAFGNRAFLRTTERRSGCSTGLWVLKLERPTAKTPLYLGVPVKRA